MQSALPERNNSAIIPFDFEGTSVRVINIDGNPWWVLSDVCQVLEIRNNRDAASRLDDDEKGVVTTDTLGGPQKTVIINQSGAFSLALTSRKPAARRFKKWLTAVVVPSILRTGSYSIHPVAPPPSLAEMTLQVVTGLQAQIKEQAQQVAQQAAQLANKAEIIEFQTGMLEDSMPKAKVHDRIASAAGSLCVTDAAKALKIPPSVLFRWLSENDWIYKRRGSAVWIAYQARLKSRHLEHKITTVERGDGSEKIVEQVRVTTKGLILLAGRVPEAAARATMPNPRRRPLLDSDNDNRPDAVDDGLEPDGCTRMDLEEWEKWRSRTVR